ncbi:MAG: DUF11 domain-containing protein, partial [Anaerolineae bacterium]|nr:DUF11 domain-containing protein [Anaerolineae bacterium]
FTPTWTATPSRTPTQTATPSPTATPELGVTKIAEEAGLRIVVANSGQAPANNVGVVESLRPGVRYISSRPGAPVCIEDAGIVYCTLGTILGGASAEVDLTVSTDGTDPTSGRTIITSGGLQLIVIDEPYLLKIGEPPVAGPGTVVTYTLRVINPTEATARQIQVQDRMPEALEILSANATSGVVEVRGQSILFTQAEMNAGGRVTLTVVTRVREGDGFDQIINRACLTSLSNRTPSCAQMRFLRASEIPSTGESPLRPWLLTGIAALIMKAVAVVIRRRRASPRQH